MATASYISNNDYNLVKDIRPFDMPYQSTIQEISTKQQYWKLGADRIKSAYEQAAGLNPQYTQGKEYLKGFMQDATKSLEKLSKSDLSVMDNSQQAIGVFKPLFDVSNPLNEELLMDSELYYHYKKQNQTSDIYRTKDGGKEWNENNDFYYKKSQQKYLQDAEKGDYSTIRDNFKNRKSFIPYYDYKKELSDIQEMCKGASSDTQDVSGMYLHQSSRSGCTPEQLSLAFQTGLSDRARQQIHIDGFRNFYGNEDSLARRFKEINVDGFKAISDKLQIEIAAIELGGVSKDELQKLQEKKALQQEYNKKYSSSLEEYNNITKGNSIDYIKNNYDKIAGDVYFNDISMQLGNAFRTDKSVEKLTPDAVSMLIYKSNAERNLAILNNNAAAKLEEQKHNYKLEENAQDAALKLLQAKKEGKVDDNTPGKTILSPEYNNITDDDLKVTPNKYYNEKVAPAKQATDDSFENLSSYLNQKINLGGELTTTNIDNFIKFHFGKEGPKDPKIIELYKKFKQNNREYTKHLDVMQVAEQQAEIEKPSVFNSENLKDLKPVKLVINNQNINVTPEDILKAKQGKPNSSGLVIKSVYSSPNSAGISSTGILVNSQGGYSNEYYINGVKIDFNNKSGIINQDFSKLLGQVDKKQGENIAEQNKLKTKYLTDYYYKQGDFREPSKFAKEGEVVSRIKNAFVGLEGFGGGLDEKSGFSIPMVGKDGTKLYIIPRDKDNNPMVSSAPKNIVLQALQGISRGSGEDVKVVTLPTGQKAYSVPNVGAIDENLPETRVLQKQEADLEDLRLLEAQTNINKSFNATAYADGEKIGFARQFYTLSGAEVTVYPIKTKGQPLQYKLIFEGVKEPIYANSKEQVAEYLKTRNF